MPVGRLQERLKIAPRRSRITSSRWLSVGLITQMREATTLICHANYDTMRGLVDFLVAECCADAACGEDEDRGLIFCAP